MIALAGPLIVGKPLRQILLVIFAEDLENSAGGKFSLSVVNHFVLRRSHRMSQSHASNNYSKNIFHRDTLL